MNLPCSLDFEDIINSSNITIADLHNVREIVVKKIKSQKKCANNDNYKFVNGIEMKVTKTR